jgi:gas vesicle protein
MGARTDRGGSETFSFIGGLILGFIISAPVAAWLSPRSGEETRSEIRQRGVVIRRRAEETLRKPLEQVQERVEQLKGEAIEDAMQEGKSIAAAQQAAALQSGTE